MTNAAGGLNPTYNVGDIACIMDHVCLPMLAGNNPLIGPNDAELGPRFPPMSNAYDEELQSLVMVSAKRLGLEHKVKHNGVYCFVSGPMYESKAECRFLRRIGGDAVGMSTIPEIAAAHHSGMKVLCLSVITNKVIISGDEGPAANHEEVLDAVNQCSKEIQALLTDIIVNSGMYVQSLPELPSLSDAVSKPDPEKKCSFSKTVVCPWSKDGCGLRLCGIPVHCIVMFSGMMAIGAAVTTTVLLKLSKK